MATPKKKPAATNKKPAATTSARLTTPVPAAASNSSLPPAPPARKVSVDAKPVFPPLPAPITTTRQIPEEWKTIPIEKLRQLEAFKPFKLYSLNTGCYLVHLQLSGLSYHYDGTIRVEHQGTNTVASGDLYYHKPNVIWPPITTVGGQTTGTFNPSVAALSALNEPNPANGIPVFARAAYRYYLKITTILEWISFDNSFTLGFEMWKFNGANTTPMWTKEGSFTALLTFGAAPASYPSGADYLTGQVKNSSGVVVGDLRMGWVSKYLRRATVEIDRVSVSEAPLDSGLGHTWQSVFDEVGWQMNIVQSDSNVAQPSGTSWSEGEMHAGMLARRDSSDLDKEWRYHILCVRLIDSTPRGVMYDHDATDSNNVAREGIGIASHWTIPNTSEWGKVKNLRFGTAKAPYFRTALHEIGHAMGLYHNTVDMGIMNTTDVIAASAMSPVQFPDNIKWSHAPDDQKRLRHMPDIYVRPGGVPFGSNYSVHPISPNDEHQEAEGLVLQLEPVTDVLPLGAPVRVEMRLTNASDMPLPAPQTLNMKYGCVKGTVIDPTGISRGFSSLVLCVDEVALAWLQPGESVDSALTLLRGGAGALFPIAGTYTVEVTVEWDMGEDHAAVTGQTNVFVTTPQTERHARAAMKVLSTPDTLLSLVLTGDHLTEGNAAIQAALDTPELRPYFAYIEAKRLIKPFGSRKANRKAAAQLLNGDVVMNSAEEAKADRLLQESEDTGRQH